MNDHSTSKIHLDCAGRRSGKGRDTVEFVCSSMAPIRVINTAKARPGSGWCPPTAHNHTVVPRVRWSVRRAHRAAPHPVQAAGPAYDFADLRAVWSMLVHVHSSTVGHSAARPLPSSFHLHHPTTASSAGLLHRPDSLRAELVQGEPHESTGFGDG